MAKAPRKPDVLRTIEQLTRAGQALPPAATSFVQVKRSTADLVLSEAYADVPGCTFTTPFASNWNVRATVDIENSAGFLFWICVVNGVALGGEGHMNVNGRLSLATEWQTGYLAKSSVIKLQGKRGGGAGRIYQVHTAMAVQRCL